MDAILPLIGVVLGSALTYVFGWLSANVAAKREDARAVKADAQRLAAIGREHAAGALAVIRTARAEAWTRSREEGARDIETRDLGLEVAQAEIELIPDPVLRPRLASVLNLVRYPWTLANSSFSEGWPVGTQREGLYLLGEALAAYIREEPTPSTTDRLAALANANDNAHTERDDWEAERIKEEKEAPGSRSPDPNRR